MGQTISAKLIKRHFDGRQKDALASPNHQNIKKRDSIPNLRATMFLLNVKQPPKMNQRMIFPPRINARFKMIVSTLRELLQAFGAV